jgi:hypothetical protein
VVATSRWMRSVVSESGNQPGTGELAHRSTIGTAFAPAYLLRGAHRPASRHSREQEHDCSHYDCRDRGDTSWARSHGGRGY